MAGAVIRLACALLLAAAGPAMGQLLRLDHIPTAVLDLDQAVADFRGLGFSIKPGRVHGNGLRNAHIKFDNGAGLELIHVAEARDALTAHYAEFQRQGEGPAYLALHADDESRVAAALQAAGIAHRRDADGLTLGDPRLAWIFFTADNRSPTDRPEHFAHANGTFATREVWVALDGAEAALLAQLLTAVGATSHVEQRRTPFETSAHVFELANRGRIVIVPGRHRRVAGHAIVAVLLASRAGPARWVPPSLAHGAWLGWQP
ncbi:VOC family protein [Roseateles cellulosilyticus]|uniref:VOC family protein n=1 Tax=Pelomonas cellulosilytica TaxID=2906762 RepID=A0ABS8XRI6_9BURK|nr:VOC family protein [Pelomonas sp. P8]MCE4554468.1 VOC family protein [Pelomonas sp. P8]